MIEFSFWLWLGLTLVVIGAELTRRRRSSRGTLCPGPRVSSWRRWVWSPWSWFVVRGCWYNLSGCAANSHGRVRCPECGVLHDGDSLRPRRQRYIRFVPTVAALIVLALTCRNVRWLRGGGWAKLLPADVLLAIETFRPGEWSKPARDELWTRQENGSLWDRQGRWLERVAIDELRDDSIDWNSRWAMEVLEQRLEAATAGLETALDSPDRQCRQLAAHLLRDRSRRGRTAAKEHGLPSLSPYVPPDRLFAVTIEGLADDTLPWDSGRHRQTLIDNAYDGVGFLADNSARAESLCDKALDSGDRQQRLLSAAVLSFTAKDKRIDRVAPVLIEQLGSDEAEGNAVLAAKALLALGPGALPFVDSGSESRDAQRAMSCELVRVRLLEPATLMEIRRKLNVIRRSFWDPLEENGWHWLSLGPKR